MTKNPIVNSKLLSSIIKFGKVTISQLNSLKNYMLNNVTNSMCI